MAKEEIDFYAVWRDTIARARMAANSTIEEQREAVLSLEIISLGMAVAYPTPEEREEAEFLQLKKELPEALDAIGSAIPKLDQPTTKPKGKRFVLF